MSSFLTLKIHLNERVFFDRTAAKYWMMGAFGLGALLLSVVAFLVFAGVAVLRLVAATRMIETRNLRLEDIAR